MGKKKRPKKRKPAAPAFPIKYWSHSSLMSFLRNPLAWYKRYVLCIYDIPRSPASLVGIAGHVALEHFYGGFAKDQAIEMGLLYLRAVPDFEINFGIAKTKKAKKAKRESMEREYLQAIGFYLARPPRHRVLGIEVKAVAEVPGLPLPVKSVSDLVVESKGNPGCIDIVDHKFVESFSNAGDKASYLLQAVFNYYTIGKLYGREVKRFIVIECKKGKNKNGKSQLRRFSCEYDQMEETFELFQRLVTDATLELQEKRRFLPNPSDMFEGQHSFDVYRLRLLED